MGPRCPLDNPSLVLVEGPSASPDLDWHLTYCRDLKSRKFTTTKYEYTNVKKKCQQCVCHPRLYNPLAWKRWRQFCMIQGLCDQNRDCSQWQASSCFKIIGRLHCTGGIIPFPSLGDGQLHLYFTDALRKRSRGGAVGGTTNPYSFLAKKNTFFTWFSKSLID